MQEQTLIPEVEEFISEPEFERMIRYLAIQFGEAMTLSGLNKEIQIRKPMPTKKIDGREYVAGYGGKLMVPPGQYKAKLIDIHERGGQCKLLFTIDDVFLYHSLQKDELSIERIVNMAKQIGAEFGVTVEHTTVHNTGNHHAVISGVDWEGISVELPAE
jgi:hypothetical protein